MIKNKKTNSNPDSESSSRVRKGIFSLLVESSVVSEALYAMKTKFPRIPRSSTQILMIV